MVLHLFRSTGKRCIYLESSRNVDVDIYTKYERKIRQIYFILL